MVKTRSHARIAGSTPALAIKNKRKGVSYMNCGITNCEECPYPDCICDQTSIMKNMAKHKKNQKKTEKQLKRQEYDTQYYENHKEEKKAKSLERYYKRKQKRGY